jgi:hypothetical protein
MTENFEVAQSGSEGELSDSKRHEVVAAQLRGEAKVAGQGAEAVVAAVAEELEGIGLEPNPAELHRRYEEIDPDLPVLGDAEESAAGEEGEAGEAGEVPADAGTRAVAQDARTEGPVSAGVDAGRDRAPVDQAPVDHAQVDHAPVDDTGEAHDPR